MPEEKKALSKEEVVTELNKTTAGAPFIQARCDELHLASTLNEIEEMGLKTINIYELGIRKTEEGEPIMLFLAVAVKAKPQPQGSMIAPPFPSMVPGGPGGQH